VSTPIDGWVSSSSFPSTVFVLRDPENAPEGVPAAVTVTGVLPGDGPDRELILTPVDFGASSIISAAFDRFEAFYEPQAAPSVAQALEDQIDTLVRQAATR
jgi:hypothetical protein